MILATVSSRIGVSAQGGGCSYPGDVIVEQERRREVQWACVRETPSWRLPDGACGGRPPHHVVLQSHMPAISGDSIVRSTFIGFWFNFASDDVKKL